MTHEVYDVAFIPSLLHQNNIGVNLCRNFKFQNGTNKIYAIIFCGNDLVYDYSYESPFVSTPVHTIDGVRSIPQTPRGIKFVSLHKDIPREVNRVFVKPSDPRKNGSNH
jgi:hypothetical protein